MSHFPETSWKRLHPHLDLSTDELRHLLDATCGRADIAQHSLLTGGKCNTNILVRFTDGARAVVRIYERDPSACRRDEIIAELVRPEVPAPAVLATLTDASETVPPTLAKRLDGRSVAIFEWIDGVTPMDAFEQGGAQASEQIAYALGRTLADIGHAREFPHHGLFDEELDYRRRFESIEGSFVDFIDWSLTDGRAGERLGASLTKRVATFARDNAALLGAVEGDHRLVHGDYKLSNLLVRRVQDRHDEWKVVAVLDWEFASAGTQLFDAAILLRHVAHFPGDFQGAFARGFRDHGGRLPDHWRNITRLLDLMNLCGFLNASGQRRRLFDDVRELVRRTVQ